jgi:hypothetical protein
MLYRLTGHDASRQAESIISPSPHYVRKLVPLRDPREANPSLLYHHLPIMPFTDLSFPAVTATWRQGSPNQYVLVGTYVSSNETPTVQFSIQVNPNVEGDVTPLVTGILLVPIHRAHQSGLHVNQQPFPIY